MTDDKPAIALLGLGRMGGAMAAHLLAEGYALTVWNRTAAKAEPLAAAGAKVAETPALAVADVDIVITMLADPAALEAVADEFVPALPPSATVIEMSTVGPAALTAFASRLPDDVRLIDAPALGSVDKASTGGLTLLTGGDAEVIEGVRPVLETLGTVVPTGPSGSGAAAKLVLMGGILSALTVVGETLVIAASLGLPEDVARSVIRTGPLAGILARSESTTSDFPISLAAKDLLLAQEAAGRELPVLAAAEAHLRRVEALGHGQDELARAVELMR
ncbi:3-hydroxyisobutyrate dehydrogenase [Actinorhabdospora filicis]|uniref:3-hydroxyisobutyrate dehydrogenase n=1 Tax=Actinorhabdospora filicis TaxID=1785913 RepID=A0A9W6SQG2_9ACTN|nr:NAD(P)-dependent oxidoreductase [Actinorhabdospora filicis]GLZ80115.1 3-hydroxyisobutyrate dehydrogenase [Actinorhabdospora filicis]